MNSRNYIPEQTLLDRLLADDAAAMEELTRRYCFSLYHYANSKLDSPEDAKRIVRNIFIALWEDRQLIPADFSLPVHLYTEVRKAVVQYIHNKLNSAAGISAIEEKIIPGFNTEELQKAKQPVQNIYTKRSFYQPSVNSHRSYEESWWGKHTPSISLKGLKHALQSMVNF